MPKHVVDRDLGWSAIIRRLKTPRTDAVLVGFDGRDDPDLPRIAAKNEFGGEDVPERSFMRSTISRNRKAYLDTLRVVEDAYVMTGLSPAVPLLAVGRRVADDMSDTILGGINPPNEPETLEQKEGNTPLIDTGHLITSIVYRIEEG